jgi:hypothetical protein
MVVTPPATATISLRRDEDVKVTDPFPEVPSWPIGDDMFDPPEPWLTGIPQDTWLDAGTYDIEIRVAGGANRRNSRLRGWNLQLTITPSVIVGSRAGFNVQLPIVCLRELIVDRDSERPISVSSLAMAFHEHDTLLRPDRVRARVPTSSTERLAHAHALRKLTKELGLSAVSELFEAIVVSSAA